MDVPLRFAQPSPCGGAGVTNEGMAPIGVVPESDPLRIWFEESAQSLNELRVPPQAEDPHQQTVLTEHLGSALQEALTTSGFGAGVICPHCHLETPITVDGVRVDACFGDLLGSVVNACCGHGDRERAYVRIDRVHSNGTDGFCDIRGGDPPPPFRSEEA